MRKSVRRLALVAAMALLPMGAMTMPTASSAPCDDGQFWSPPSNACRPLPCPYGSQFEPNADVCHCNPGWLRNALLDICESPAIYGPPIWGH
jgi:hypothetical protein